MSRLEPTNEASAIAEQGGGTTKVEQLIQQYCPDGVEYKRLGDVLGVNRGRRLTKMQLSDDGQYYVYHGSKDTPLGKYSQFNVKGNTTIVVNTGGIGGVKFCDDDFWCSDGSFWIGHSDLFNDKFVFYYLSPLEPYFASQKRVGGVPTIDRSVVENVEIPVPPLPVQEEIVRILDTLTELQAELQAELQKRLQQYNYYRDNILSFEGRTDIEWKKLGDVVSISRGASPRPIQNYLTNEEDGIPWIKIGDVSTNSKYITSTAERITREGASKSRFLNKGTFILSNSMSFGRPYILGIDGCIHDGWISICDFEASLNSDFLYYLLRSSDVQGYWISKANSGGAVANLNSDIVRSTPIPVPPLAEQQRIVDILDRFSTLTTDITAGLPAEIEARRKQYEYYREQLLNFKQKA